MQKLFVRVLDLLDGNGVVVRCDGDVTAVNHSKIMGQFIKIGFEWAIVNKDRKDRSLA